MSKTVQWKRGNAAVNDTYVGAPGEITVNTDDYTLLVHDGVTPGGNPSSRTGNLSISDQTISGLNANGNIVISPNGTGVLSSTGTVIAPQFILRNNNRNNFIISNTASGVLMTTTVQSSPNVSYSSDLAIKVAANLPYAGIFLNGTSGRAGINTTVSNAINGYTFTVNGSAYATEFYARADFPTGYQFTTPLGDTGFSHTYQNDIHGNVSLLRIRHDNTVVARFYDNNTTLLSGNIVVAASGGEIQTSFPNAFVQVSANINSYSQIVTQNWSDGDLSSSDFVATADNGDDASYYVDLGIASSSQADPGFFGDTKTYNDAYLYVTAYDQAGPSWGNVGNLILGSTNGLVKTFVGNTAEANVVTVVDRTGLLPGANVTYNLGSQYAQWKDLWVSNSTIYINSIPLTIDSNGTLTVNGAPVSGTANTGDITFAQSTITGLGTNVTLTADTVDWIFDSNGNLTVPANGNLVTSDGNLFALSLAQLKSIVASSNSWSEFQSNIAAL